VIPRPGFNLSVPTTACRASNWKPAIARERSNQPAGQWPWPKAFTPQRNRPRPRGAWAARCNNRARRCQTRWRTSWLQNDRTRFSRPRSPWSVQGTTRNGSA
jgi:hypothetical protein